MKYRKESGRRVDATEMKQIVVHSIQPQFFTYALVEYHISELQTLSTTPVASSVF
jgi:hypothetical protein